MKKKPTLKRQDLSGRSPKPPGKGVGLPNILYGELKRRSPGRRRSSRSKNAPGPQSWEAPPCRCALEYIDESIYGRCQVPLLYAQKARADQFISGGGLKEAPIRSLSNSEGRLLSHPSWSRRPGAAHLRLSWLSRSRCSTSSCCSCGYAVFLCILHHGLPICRVLYYTLAHEGYGFLLWS